MPHPFDREQASRFTLAVRHAVSAVPDGRVATYGDVATWIGSPRAARAVGGVLRGLREEPDTVPWHRIINAQGRISMGGSPERALLQRNLLQSEGVRFDRNGRVDLERLRWSPSPALVAEWIERFEPFDAIR